MEILQLNKNSKLLKVSETNPIYEKVTNDTSSYIQNPMFDVILNQGNTTKTTLLSLQPHLSDTLNTTGQINMTRVSVPYSITILHVAESLLIKPTVSRLIKKFSTFYRNRRFVIVFKRAATGYYPKSDESNLHNIYSRFVLVLPSHLGLGLRSGLFSSGFPTKMLY
jgi:hypothetical protein